MRATSTPALLLSTSLLLAACQKEAPKPVAPEVPSTPGPVTFGKAPHTTGERFIDSISTAMKRDEDGGVHATESRVSTLIEVIDTDGTAVNAVRVTYAEESEIDHNLGRGIHGPMHRKTFVVSSVGGELEAVEGGDDGPDGGLSATELGRLKSDFSWLGKPNPWRAAVQGKTFKYHEPSAVLARALADTMTVGWSESAATTSARFMGSDGGVAEFEVTVDQTMNASQPQRSQSKLTGTLELRVKTGDLASIDLTGPLQFWQGDTVVGTATMKVVSRRQTAEDFAKKKDKADAPR